MTTESEYSPFEVAPSKHECPNCHMSVLQEGMCTPCYVEKAYGRPKRQKWSEQWLRNIREKFDRRERKAAKEPVFKPPWKPLDVGRMVHDEMHQRRARAIGGEVR